MVSSVIGWMESVERERERERERELLGSLQLTRQRRRRADSDQSGSSSGMATVSRLESGPHRLCNEFERLVDSQPLEDFWPFLFFISVDVDDYESHHRNVKIIDGIVSLRQRHWIMKEKQMEDVGADYGIAGFFFLIDPLDRDRDGSGWRSEFSFGAFLFLFVFFFLLFGASSCQLGSLRTHLAAGSIACARWLGRKSDRVAITRVCVCVCVCAPRFDHWSRETIIYRWIRFEPVGHPLLWFDGSIFFFSVLAQRQYFNPQKTQHHV